MVRWIRYDVNGKWMYLFKFEVITTANVVFKAKMWHIPSS